MICAYLAGSICGFLLPLLLVRCAQYSLLPTSTAILSVGVSAMLSGVLASTLCGPINLITDLGPKLMYECACALSMLLFGSVRDGFTIFGGILGWMVSWGSEQGYYHVIMLPLIALGMDGGNFSVLGTLDSFCLCVPCAGVCFAVYLLSAYPIPPRQVVTSENSSSISCRSKITSPQTNEKTSPHPVVIGGHNHHLRQGMKGTISNFFMGDYVEACYPYTLHNRWVLLSVRISTAIAGGLMLGYLGLQADRIQLMPPTSCLAASAGTTADYQLRSSAYLPLPLTILLATMSATSRKDDIPYDSCLNLAVDNIIPSESIILTRGITAKLSHLTGVGVLSGPFVIFIIVFMSFFLPFFTTLIIYSSKGLSKK